MLGFGLWFRIDSILNESIVDTHDRFVNLYPILPGRTEPAPTQPNLMNSLPVHRSVQEKRDLEQQLLDAQRRIEAQQSQLAALIEARNLSRATSPRSLATVDTQGSSCSSVFVPLALDSNNVQVRRLEQQREKSSQNLALSQKICGVGITP